MEDEPLGYKRIERIRNSAYEIFYYEQLTPSQNSQLERERHYLHNPDLVSVILDMIADQGLLHVTTYRDLIDRWRDMVTNHENSKVADWLLQASISWQLIAFVDQDDYESWLTRLAESYSSPIGEGIRKSDKGHRDSIEANIAIDDERSGKMAKFKEYRQLLESNPWLAYLATLQLSLPRIWSDFLNHDHFRALYDSQE